MNRPCHIAAGSLFETGSLCRREGQREGKGPVTLQVVDVDEAGVMLASRRKPPWGAEFISWCNGKWKIIMFIFLPTFYFVKISFKRLNYHFHRKT